MGVLTIAPMAKVDAPADRFTLITLTNGRSCASWRELVARWQFQRGRPYFELAGLSDVSQARSAAASWWLEHHTTSWCLWVDDDSVVPLEAVERFCAVAIEHEADVDLLCACYVPKRPKAGTVCVLFADEQNTLGVGGGLAPVLGCGFGCVAIKRAIFERIALTLPRVRYEQAGVRGWPFFLGMITSATQDPDGDLRHAGEDFAFCARASAAGARMFCDTRLRVGHRGEYTYHWEDAGTELERVDRIDLGRIGPGAAAVTQADLPSPAPPPDRAARRRAQRAAKRRK